MFKNFSKIISFVAVLVICISPLFVGAADGTVTGPGPDGTVTGPTSPSNTLKIEFKSPFKCSGSSCSVEGFIKAILDNILLPIGGVVAALMVMYAGFLYVTSGGNTTKIQQAHQALLYAVIGAAILLGAWVIAQVIQSTINQFKT